MPALALDRPSVHLAAAFASPSAVVSSPANYGAYLQHTTLSTVPATVIGLRNSDPCQAPWIFTPYCFVDFGQTWALANSAKRQARCQAMVANGAVFLEAVLRNVDYAVFHSCWGAAFDVAVASELQSSAAGLSWLTMVATPMLAPVAAEVAYWGHNGITTFETQWQNYKRLGVLNSYAITNAYGVSYPLTLQAQNGTYRFASQTTFKMYWSLANDLMAVVTNTTRIGGKSLVRSSANYAFANTTLGAVLVQNGTLASPLTAGFQLVESLLGPFGSVDMVYVAVPPSVRRVFSTLVELSRVPLAGNMAAQADYFNIT
ncbi:hypothetical protein ACHHYP_16322, partial [Achlya hypogyna]